MKTKVRALTGTLAEVQARYAELENKIERFEFVALNNGLVTLVYVAIVEEAKIEVKYLLWDKCKVAKTYHADIKLPFNGISDCYGLTIFKENNRWFIMGEDHDVTDYEENLDWEGKVIGFKTLWEAKEASEGIRESMQRCSQEA